MIFGANFFLHILHESSRMAIEARTRPRVSSNALYGSEKAIFLSEKAAKYSVRDERELPRHVLDRPDRVARQGLVNHHADNTHHRCAAIVALRVELVLPHGRIRVAHPRDTVADHITRLPV